MYNHQMLKINNVFIRISVPSNQIPFFKFINTFFLLMFLLYLSAFIWSKQVHPNTCKTIHIKIEYLIFYEIDAARK